MTPTSQSGKTLADVARVFPGILDLAGTVASSTLNQYRLDALRFLAYCAVHDISPLSEGSVGSWRGSMIGETRLSPHTINRKIAAIKRIIRASAKTGDLSPDLANRVSLIDPVKVSSLRHRLRKDARTRLEPGEVRRLVSAPDTSTLLGLRDHALLATLVGSGGRISEVVTLQVDNIVQTPTGLLVRLLGKGQSEARAAPLSHEAHEALCAWLRARAKYVDVQAVFTGFHGPLGGWRPIARPLSSKGHGGSYANMQSKPVLRRLNRTIYAVSWGRNLRPRTCERHSSHWGTSGWIRRLGITFWTSWSQA